MFTKSIGDFVSIVHRAALEYREPKYTIAKKIIRGFPVNDKQFISPNIKEVISKNEFYSVNVVTEKLSDIPSFTLAINTLNEYVDVNFSKFISTVLFTIIVTLRLVSNNFTEDLDVHLFLIDEPKVLTVVPVSYMDVNSGLTIAAGEKRTIVIFRREEVFKVLIHEVIHAAGAERILYEYINEINDCIYKLIPWMTPSYHDRPAEHYVEYLAELILFSLESVIRNYKSEDNTSLLNDVLLNIDREIEHSSKIIMTVIGKTGLPFRQDSNFINYYFIRHAMMNLTRKEGEVYLLSRSYDDEYEFSINEYCELLKRAIESISGKDLNYFNSSSLPKTTTLRMTITKIFYDM